MPIPDKTIDDVSKLVSKARESADLLGRLTEAGVAIQRHTLAHAATQTYRLCDALESVAKKYDEALKDREFLHQRRGELVIERDHALTELREVTDRRDKLASHIGTMTGELAAVAKERDELAEAVGEVRALILAAILEWPEDALKPLAAWVDRRAALEKLNAK